MPGESVYIRKLGQIVMLFPKEESWNSLADACKRFSEDFMEARDQGFQDRDEPFG